MAFGEFAISRCYLWKHLWNKEWHESKYEGMDELEEAGNVKPVLNRRLFFCTYRQKECFSHNKMLSHECSITQSKFSTSKTGNLQTEITPFLQYFLFTNHPLLKYVLLSYFRHLKSNPEARELKNAILPNRYTARNFLLEILCHWRGLKSVLKWKPYILALLFPIFHHSYRCGTMLGMISQNPKPHLILT